MKRAGALDAVVGSSLELCAPVVGGRAPRGVVGRVVRAADVVDCGVEAVQAEGRGRVGVADGRGDEGREREGRERVAGCGLRVSCGGCEDVAVGDDAARGGRGCWNTGAEAKVGGGGVSERERERDTRGRSGRTVSESERVQATTGALLYECEPPGSEGEVDGATRALLDGEQLEGGQRGGGGGSGGGDGRVRARVGAPTQAQHVSSVPR